MTLADSILMEMDQEAPTTRKVLEQVPEDKLSWRPHPKSFSLGQLALHLASAPAGIAAAALADTFERPNFAPPEPRSRKDILETFWQSLDAAKSMVSKMDDARLLSTWNLTSNKKVVLSVPRISFLRSILMNHTNLRPERR